MAEEGRGPGAAASRLYVFVDESGGHVAGRKAFVVAVVVVSDSGLEALEAKLLALEAASWRGKRKWSDSAGPEREAYLSGLAAVAEVTGPYYWRLHPDAVERDVKTAETVVAAIRTHDAEDRSRRVIIVDALAKANRDRMTGVFKHCNLQRREVRDGRDESSPFLRLADALAGFLRHVAEDESYAVRWWRTLQTLFHRV